MFNVSELVEQSLKLRAPYNYFLLYLGVSSNIVLSALDQCLEFMVLGIRYENMNATVMNTLRGI